MVYYLPTVRDVETFKKLILIELDREAPRREIVVKLVVQLQKKEREELFTRIQTARPSLNLS